jgi:hypothetical protein
MVALTAVELAVLGGMVVPVLEVHRLSVLFGTVLLVEHRPSLQQT